MFQAEPKTTPIIRSLLADIEDNLCLLCLEPVDEKSDKKKRLSSSIGSCFYLDYQTSCSHRYHAGCIYDLYRHDYLHCLLCQQAFQPQATLGPFRFQRVCGFVSRFQQNLSQWTSFLFSTSHIVVCEPFLFCLFGSCCWMVYVVF